MLAIAPRRRGRWSSGGDSVRSLDARRFGDDNVGVHGAVALAPPEAISDERGQGHRAEQQQQPRAAVAAQELRGALADEIADYDPRRRVEQCSGEIEGDELAIRDVTAAG